MTSWKVDPSEPRISPESFLRYYGELMGGDLETLTLPAILVATFQRQAFGHMVTRIEGSEVSRWPSSIHWPLARGTFRGRELAITRLPMGAAAAVMAMEMMIAAGARSVLLVGSAGSLQPSLLIGSLVVANRSLRYEGVSYHYLPADEPAEASPELVDALLSTALREGLPSPLVGPSWTTDAPYRECADTILRLSGSGVLVVEMEAAGLFAIAKHRGARAALIVAVSDELHDRWKPGFLSLAYRRALLQAADIALCTASVLSTE